jgi:hypothetical protein
MAGDADRSVRNLLANALANCLHDREMTREQIASEMTARLGVEVTKSKLDDFTRSGKPKRQYRFPASFVRVIAEITGDDELARSLLPDRLQVLLTVGELCLQSCGTLERALAELKKLKVRKQRIRRS